MLPDGIRNASTRNVRRKNQTRSATRIDFVHSQNQMTIDAGCAVGRAVMYKHPHLKLNQSGAGLKSSMAVERLWEGHSG